MPKFAGWMATYGLTPGRVARRQPNKADDDGRRRPACCRRSREGDRLELKALRPEQKFTQPPPRFTEATLVKELEENGIGRPSTYASIIGVLQDRDYVNKLEGRFKPTALGRDHQRPADQELRGHHRRRVHAQPRGRSRQDRAGQDRLRRRTLGEFYKKFKKDLARAGEEMQNLKEGHQDRRDLRPLRLADADQGRASSVRSSPAARYPECTNTRELEKSEPGVRGRRGGDRAVRELRQADGDEARPVRSVPGLLRLSRVQDDEQADRHQAGQPEGGEAGPDPRREVPALQLEPGDQAGPVRRVHGLHELSRAASTSSTRPPASKCPKDADKGGEIVERKSQARQDVLRLLELSGLRLRAVEPADRRDVPEVRARRSWSRRSPSATADSSSATTRSATTCAEATGTSLPRDRHA